MSGNAAQASLFETKSLMQVVNVYEQIIDMSIAQYIKYLNDMDKSYIKEKIDTNRA